MLYKRKKANATPHAHVKKKWQKTATTRQSIQFQEAILAGNFDPQFNSYFY